MLIVDEAQDLSIEALEQVRLLTNLETDTQKLLQIVLLGQPELRTLLAREDLRQLAQRITARFHLTPLDAAETERYLRHRYSVAGGRHLPFTRAAVRRLHALSGNCSSASRHSVVLPVPTSPVSCTNPPLPPWPMPNSRCASASRWRSLRNTKRGSGVIENGASARP